ncbi:hypothetical protein H4582DRAFT_1809058 [Lactarius indigo]|nr:hypothetical protein H4582DRAFT_1809058 [Lactarius indigo]
MVERWKGEADSTLIFAGLFSAVIMVSFIESYKWFLFPDSSDQTVNLLTQISGQLSNASEEAHLENIAVKSGHSIGSTTAFLVNLTWFISMALCFSCSVGATLVQQWARRYLVLTQGQGPERMHLRKSLLDGIETFQVERTIQFMGISMHSSILFYVLGVMRFIFDINTALGFIALGICIVLGLMYLIVTFLPLFSLYCPYSTPWTAFAWRTTHLILFAMSSTIRFMGGSRWRGMLEKRVDMHRRRFWDGQQKTIQLHAFKTRQAAADVEKASTE